MRMRNVAAFLAVLAALAGGWVLSSPAFSQTKLKEVEKQIDSTQKKISKRKGTEKVLASDIARWSRRINKLQGSISTLESRQERIERDLDARSEQLGRTQRELRFQRARLTRLRTKLKQGQVLLAKRLVDLYQADRPDLLSVVLSSNGFADLIQRSEFLGRIQAQDERIITTVRSAKKDATETTAR
ncbi:MAG TPA: hypothetical protein PKB03_01515, partial [Baekduia sp.]|nr:hypothetical protein [Baekduia sp.]